MDPLSVASGVAGLIPLAEVVISRTYNTIITCKHASEDSRRMLREVQSLAGILHSLANLESKLGATALQSQIPAAQVLACQRTLQNMCDKLEKADPKEEGISMVRRVKRTLRWPVSASDTDTFLAEMERHKSTFDLALSVDALDVIVGTHEAERMVFATVESMADTVDMLWKAEITHELKDLLRSVGAENSDEAYRASRKLHQHGTGVWFLEAGKPFNEWLRTPGSKLWVHGIPGAGKTILSALAIGQVADSATTNHGMCFFYCSPRQDESQNLAGVLGCLIGQLARQNEECMEILAEKARLHTNTSMQTWKRSVEDLLVVLRKMIRIFRDLSMIVDGLDECHEASLITETLTNLASDFSHVRIALFSRREAGMEPFLHDFKTLSIAAESQDLRLYVLAQIEERTRLRKLRIRDPDIKDEIIEKLVTGADGMFRWVTCQLDHLCTLITDAERLAALEKLPSTLEETYDRILERVNARSESACVLVERTLSWLFGQTTLMNGMQLCEAVSIEPGASSLDPKTLIDLDEITINCSSLVRLSASDSGTIESAHFTVEEYLRSIDPIRKPHLARFRWNESCAAQYKAEVCLTAITFTNLSYAVIDGWASVLEHDRQFPFYWYAASSWFSYSSQCQRTDLIQNLTVELFCAASRNNFEIWRHIFVLCQEMGSGILPEPTGSSSLQMRALAVQSRSSELHFAAMLHQDHLLSQLVRSSGHLNDTSSFGTPLHCALFGPQVLELVIHRSDPRYVISPRIVVDQAANRTVDTLIDLGAQLDLEFTFKEDQKAATVLIAAQTGHLKTILDAGAALDTETAAFLLPLVPAEELAFLSDLDVRNVAEHDRPAVALLLRKLRQNAVKETNMAPTLFVPSSGNPAELSFEYQRELYRACTVDDLAMFQWIFEESACSIAEHELRGRPLFHWACEHSASSIATYLIAQGAHTNEVDSEGSATPLGKLLKSSTGFQKSSLVLVKLLLAANVSVTSIDKDANSALMLWASKSVDGQQNLAIMQEALELLLSYQADPRLRNKAGRNVWHFLAGNKDGHRLARRIYQRLSDEAFRHMMDLADNQGMTPLHVATSSGRDSMMQILIDSGSNVLAKDLKGRTILHMAVAGLRYSRLPLDIALKLESDGVAHETDGPAALCDCIKSICKHPCYGESKTQKHIPSDMPERIEKASTALPTLFPTVATKNKHYSNAVSVMVKCFADYGHHPMETCEICTLRLKCFALLLIGPANSRKRDPHDFGNLCTLFKGLRDSAWSYTIVPMSTACTSAICTMLQPTLEVRNDDLREFLVTSAAFETAISVGHPKIIRALLDLGIDVDATGLCLNDLTLVQRLCQCCAPESIIAVALSRTQRLLSLDDAGNTLLHLCCQSEESTINPLEGARECVIQLLVGAGIDINARSPKGGLTALMLVAEARAPKSLNLLLELGADFSILGDPGNNALLSACIYGCVESVHSLLLRGCPFVYVDISLPDFRPGKGFIAGPFQAAASRGRIEVLTLLYEITEEQNTREIELGVPSTLWMACALRWNLSTVRFLLRRGANVHFKDAKKHRTALHVAAIVGSVDVIEVLLQAGCDISALDCHNHTAEMYALIEGHKAAAKLLRRDGVDSKKPVHSLGITRYRDFLPDSFEHIIKKGNLKLIKSMAATGVNMALRFESCDCTPLLVAIRNGKVAIVGYLQSIGISMIGRACRSHWERDFSILELLAARRTMVAPLEAAVNLLSMLSNEDFNSVMESAVFNGNVGALRLLLSTGRQHHFDPSVRRKIYICIYDSENDEWDVNDTNAQGPILHTATPMDEPQLEIVQMLLEHGYDPDVHDLEGKSVSHYAAWEGHIDLLELLFANGGDVNARSVHMETPLRIAASANEIETVRFLLESGADPTAVDAAGQTVCVGLVKSSWKAAIATSQLLIRHGMIPPPADIAAMFMAGRGALSILTEHFDRVIHDPVLLCIPLDLPITRNLLRLIPPPYRELNLVSRLYKSGPNAMYRAAELNSVPVLRLLLKSGALLNLECGSEGTSLMGACKSGRLDVVKYLVRNGALISYNKGESVISAFVKASSHPKIQHWFLVKRFTEQRRISADKNENGPEPANSDAEEDILRQHVTSNKTAALDLRLVLEEDIEQYLESKNWFLPTTRFVDRGDGAFDQVPIDPSNFGQYRPDKLMLSLE